MIKFCWYMKYLYFKDLTSFLVTDNNRLFSDSNYKCYSFDNYIKKEVKVWFSKKMIRKRGDYSTIVCLQLSCIYFFKDKELIAADDKISYPLDSSNTKDYISKLEGIIALDKSVSINTIQSKNDLVFTNELIKLYNCLKEIFIGKIDNDDTKICDFVWEHSIYNPRNIKIEYNDMVDIEYTIKDHYLVSKSNKHKVDLLNIFEKIIFKRENKIDRNFNDRMYISYGIETKYGIYYLYRDVFSKKVSCINNARYLIIVDKLIEENTKINKLFPEYENSYKITRELNQLKHSLENEEGYDPIEDAQNRDLKRSVRKFNTALSILDFSFFLS